MEYIKGHATFTGPHEVKVGDKTYTAEHILIAAGTKPIIPKVPGKSPYNGIINIWYKYVVFVSVQVMSMELLVMVSLSWKTFQSQ